MTADDLDVRKLEKDAEHNNKLLSQLGELVDEGAMMTNMKSGRKVFIKMGEMLGMNMESAKDFDDDLSDDEVEDYFDEEDEYDS